MPGLSGEAGREAGKLFSERYIGGSKEKIVEGLNSDLIALIRRVGMGKLTSADVHAEFGEWCYAKPNADVVSVKIAKKGWLIKKARSTFHVKGLIDRRVYDVPLSESARTVEALTNAFGTRVQTDLPNP